MRAWISYVRTRVASQSVIYFIHMLTFPHFPPTPIFPLTSSNSLVNKIKPGSVEKINNPPFPKAVAPFKKMENIANFLKGIRALGMKEFEMFGTADLYEEKNINQVISSIHALGRLLQDIMPNSPFPKLGIKVVAKNVSIN